MTPQEFTSWASGRGLPNKLIKQLIRFAASQEEMKAAIDAEEPAPPIDTLAGIVHVTDKDPYGISPAASGFIIVGNCPNGDPIAVDVAGEPGSVWYIGHESMSYEPVRSVSIRVAKDVAAMIEGMVKGKFPFDYYEAKVRQRRP